MAPKANATLQKCPVVRTHRISNALEHTNFRRPFNTQTSHQMQLTLIQGCCKLSWMVILFLCGERRKREKYAVTTEANAMVVSMPAGPTKHVLENEVCGLLHGRKSRKKDACVMIFTVPAGLTEQVQRSLLPSARSKPPGSPKHGPRTGQGQTLIELRPRLSTRQEQWTLTLDPWRAAFLWNLWRGHWYYWSILPQIHSWQRIHLLTSLA